MYHLNDKKSGPFLSSRVLLSNAIDSVSNAGRAKKQVFCIAFDAALVMFSIWAAYASRLSVWLIDFQSTWYLFVILPIATSLIFMVLGIYRWVVRSSTVRLTAQIVKGVLASTVVMLSILFLFPPTYFGTPRSIFLIYFLFLISATLGVRYFWRVLVNSSGNLKKGEPVALYGAGYAGRQLLAVLENSETYRPVLFIDDDPTYKGSTVSGLQVYEFDASGIEDLLAKFEVSSVILTMPSAERQIHNEAVKKLTASSISIKTIPGLSELLLGQAEIDEVRELQIEDLLGRAPVETDLAYARSFVEGKSVMVTGGGGSIGSEIGRQLVRMNASKIVVLEQSEENLYKLIESLSNRAFATLDTGNSYDFLPVLGSVNDRELVYQLLVEHKVEVVYHAAACKHVPIVEDNPIQGIQTNIFGTKTVLEEADRAGVNSFVLISTDKAVRPENVMGATKRFAEMILQAKSKTKTDMRICMVRFGNVLGSSGSVVPKFLKQIESGGPITVTHPEMTRYFMTIPEAAQLVVQASSLAGNGEVFVLDMGEPVKIVDLAQAMIKVQGKKMVSEDPINGIEIVFGGIRPGEKIAEELFISSTVSATPYEKILQEKVNALDWVQIKEVLRVFEQLCEKRKVEELQDLLMRVTLFDHEALGKLQTDGTDVCSKRTLVSQEA